jgi:hypothetical protein
MATNKTNECEGCNAYIISGIVIHEPNCPICYPND